ncbi:MAG: ATP-binding protein [Dongiaceae bacterium]
MTKTTRPLEMKISLNALEHLGMNLYSSIPAVLSEIVANAWDGDAENVWITIDPASNQIVIEDDGLGMTRDQVIDRFLMVGYKRRADVGKLTESKRRPPMGRKGIGKLSSFSIAQVVEVFTRRGSQKTAFRMDREEIKRKISKNVSEPYRPEELTNWPSNLKGGTRISLSKLSTGFSGMTVAGLKRRIARRFSIIGPKQKFAVHIDGQLVTPADRGYHGSIEYLWVYGNQSQMISLCKGLTRVPEDRTKAISAATKKAGIELSGWLGTVRSPSQLKDEEGDNLNRIAIFMRGKMAQEDILADFGQKEIFADYVIGELHCEELDRDDKDDIATSSRQAIKLDDPRFEILRATIQAELRHIASLWSDWRRDDGTRTARTVPEVSQWLDGLQGNAKKKAERWIGRLNVIRSERESDKKELLKASILAFESFRRKEQLEKLEDIQDQSLSDVLDLFRDIDDLELSYYGQIVRLRVGVITALQEKLSVNTKELALRDYIFDHLWLLDPAWERAKGSEHVETTLNNFLKEDTKKLSKEQKNARIDIGYRTIGGKHVIVELKRASISVPIDDLTKQVRKYRDGAVKLLEKTVYKSWPIEVVCVVGRPPPEWDDATGPAGVQKALQAVDARIVFYDELLSNAQQAYADYLTVHSKRDKLWGVFQAIDDFAPEEAN